MKAIDTIKYDGSESVVIEVSKDKYIMMTSGDDGVIQYTTTASGILQAYNRSQEIVDFVIGENDDHMRDPCPITGNPCDQYSYDYSGDKTTSECLATGSTNIHMAPGGKCLK